MREPTMSAAAHSGASCAEAASISTASQHSRPYAKSSQRMTGCVGQIAVAIRTPTRSLDLHATTKTACLSFNIYSGNARFSSAPSPRGEMHGMELGLYCDLAVSVDASSSDHWANQECFSRNTRVGAPPIRSTRWVRNGVSFRSIRDALLDRLCPFHRAFAGEHAPCGCIACGPCHGLAETICHSCRSVAHRRRLSSLSARRPVVDCRTANERTRCIVIGEDLGTVPTGFRERMTDANLLSCRVLYFEQNHGRFRRPGSSPSWRRSL